jgi:hypothetical protein
LGFSLFDELPSLFCGLSATRFAVSKLGAHDLELTLHDRQLQAVNNAYNGPNNKQPNVKSDDPHFPTPNAIQFLIGFLYFLGAFICAGGGIYSLIVRSYRLGDRVAWSVRKRLLYGCPLLAVAIVLAWQGLILICGITP